MHGKALVVALALTLGAAGCHDDHDKAHAHAPGATSAAAHAHDHGEAAAVKLALDEGGRKWPTDEPLRAGMKSIRDDLQAAVVPIHAKTYTPDDYKALAARIESTIGTVVSKCKLPPRVDAQFHVVLAELVAGADVMKKDGDRMAGAAKAIGALRSYAEFFDHPGWEPVKH
jgi:hypothetical protein